MAPALLRGEAGRVAREVAGLLLLEEQPLDVLQMTLVGVRHVDDREMRLRELLRNRGHRLDLGEADADHQVVALLGERAQVRDVVRRRLRLDDTRLDAEVLCRALQSDVGEMVEAPVVQAADVGRETDLEAR